VTFDQPYSSGFHELLTSAWLNVVSISVDVTETSSPNEPSVGIIDPQYTVGLRTVHTEVVRRFSSSGRRLRIPTARP